jgi:3-methylcrotonyl-CoA carboxylase alpha subunit
MIGSILVANRGEIAVRIMRTARRLGIRTVAVYSDADRDALHVAQADEAVRIGPAPARDSYLRPDAIMEAARRTGAEGIHPGYGFLSERPELARLCEEAGIAWIGPSAECITRMGPKIGSKRIADGAGVPSVPGYAGDDQSPRRLAHEADRIGYPLMVKASAGGGGKGMRRVFAPDELGPAIELARQEAQASFGDPALLLEKLVLRPRHLEVQVAGDKHGHVVHLFERDCSVQRNNQKVLEEAPAPNLDAAIRQKLLSRGVALAQSIGYDNLGTVEFILEEGEDEPWFLEMNTRLQVEHPVTEAITGYDLVEWQIRIGSGETLPARQDEIQANGHAIEARVTAERADQGFRPDAGPIFGYREPSGVRIDTGVARGSTVTLFYDSLLAKAITHAATRESARRSLSAGLRDFAIAGPATTIPFLADAIDHPIFASGRATTRFIEDAFPDGWRPAARHARSARAAASLLALDAMRDHRAPASAWTTIRGFRVLGPAGGGAVARLVVATEAGESKLAVAMRPDGSAHVVDPDGDLAVRLAGARDGFTLESDGAVLRGSSFVDGDRVWVSVGGEAYDFRVTLEVAAVASGGSSAAGSGAVTAPMPGVVAELKVAEGDRVETGQVVVVLESMKLFTSLKVDVSGRVAEIACRPGDTVSAGKRLVLIEPDPIASDAQS